jgi:predicted TIM-barrel enzyme
MMPTNVNLFKTPSPKKRRKPGANATTTVDHRITLAMRLDMLADCELQHGHHLAAERLALQAQALREAGASA